MSDYNDDNQEVTENHIYAENVQVSDIRSTPALIEKFVIRLPKGLRNKIKHLSEQNRRSMNSEIIMVLEKHIQQNMLDHTAEDFSDAGASARMENDLNVAAGIQRPSINELSKRLENLPEEKKQALLDLLG